MVVYFPYNAPLESRPKLFDGISGVLHPFLKVNKYLRDSSGDLLLNLPALCLYLLSLRFEVVYHFAIPTALAIQRISFISVGSDSAGRL